MCPDCHPKMLWRTWAAAENERKRNLAIYKYDSRLYHCDTQSG